MGIEFSKRAVIRVIMDAMAGLDGLKDIYDKVEAMEVPTQPELVEVPEVEQYIADWYEENENDLDFKIWEYCKDWGRHDVSDQFYNWFNNIKNSPIETLIRMKDGYTVKKEQLYYVKVGNLVFVDWEDSFVAKFATMDSLEWTSYAHKIHTKDGAENIARIIGGDAVPVGEEAE